jgi:hypothetical protein
MRKPIHITAPWSTPEEVKKRYPVSKASEKAIQLLVEEFKAQLSRQNESASTSIEPEKRRKRASAA